MKFGLLALFILTFTSCSSVPRRSDAWLELDRRLTLAGSNYRAQVSQNKIRNAASLPRFYARKLNRPVWIEDGVPLPRAHILVQAIRDSARDGLIPNDFHLVAIQTLLEDSARRRQLKMDPDPSAQADLDLLLTDAFLALGNQLQSGRAKPKGAGYEWYLPKRDTQDTVAVLAQALEKDTLVEALDGLRPAIPDYTSLRKALADYRQLAAKGNWAVVTPGPVLRKDDRDKRVALLRRRLTASRDFLDKNLPEDPKLFDEPLVEALKHFQRRHGLKDTGALNPPTIRALNVSVFKRIRQLEINLERLRWMPHELPARFIGVNIANFELYVQEAGSRVLQMPVVVGTEYRHTPVFMGTLNQVVVNPSWLVPRKIALEDLLPKLRKNPQYLEKHGFTVLEKDAADKKLVETDTSEVDWKQVNDENFTYTFKQKPGTNNSLGRVKFVLPNKFGIFLHDTPAKDLFKQKVRSYSSGCVRLERPAELFEYVMGEKLDLDVDGSEEKHLTVAQPIDVLVLYQTAWADAEGAVQFRNDLYGQDELLDQFL